MLQRRPFRGCPHDPCLHGQGRPGSPDWQVPLTSLGCLCCWRVRFLTRARMLHQTKFSMTVWGRSFRSSQSLLRRAPSSLFIIPKTVVGASNLALAGGLEHSILGMEISSRDCLFRARPHLHHPKKTSLFYFDPFWEGGFATILATGSLSNNVYAFAFSPKPL